VQKINEADVSSWHFSEEVSEADDVLSLLKMYVGREFGDRR
jgi:hypothetical protein